MIQGEEEMLVHVQTNGTQSQLLYPRCGSKWRYLPRRNVQVSLNKKEIPYISIQKLERWDGLLSSYAITFRDLLTGNDHHSKLKGVGVGGLIFWGSEVSCFCVVKCACAEVYKHQLSILVNCTAEWACSIIWGSEVSCFHNVHSQKYINISSIAHW